MLRRLRHFALLGSLLAFPAFAQAAEEEAFVPIFDGKSLEGWDGNPEFWRVEDGAITGQTTQEKPTKGNTFIVWNEGQLDDFELRLKFRIVGGNSGIQYRSREAGKWVIAGYQADFDGSNAWTGTLYEEKGRGVLAKRGQKVEIGENGEKKAVGATTPEAEIVEAIKAEDWNDYTIIAKGNHLQQFVNGKLTVDVVDHEAAKRAMSGLLALQLHAGPPMLVQFKDIRLKRLPLAAKKKVVFIAGKRSHGFGSHEHAAGCLLLARALNESNSGVQATVYTNGWPSDPTAFDNADAVVLYPDGGGGHFANGKLKELDALHQRGVGIGCIHYAVETVKGPPGEHFLKWMGGYFEPHWSVNPHWTAEYKAIPEHPTTRGVKPFAINDEWYYHMRFRPEMEGVTPLLSALPPESTLSRPDGAHSGNPHVREAVKNGEVQHMAWASESASGGRGFGFTGGHNHWNWGHDQFRKLVLNACVWLTGAEVPAGGVESPTPSVDDLLANQDDAAPNNFNKGQIEQRLNEWNGSAE